MRHSEFPHQQAVAEDFNGLCGNWESTAYLGMVV